MAENLIDVVLPSNLTEPLKNASDTNKQVFDFICTGVQYIPGIASNETVHGLYEFSVKYSRIHGYIAVAVCLFGVLSNSANIIVLTRKNMASIADLLTMIDYLPFAIHFYIMKPVDTKGPPFSTPEYTWICFLLFHASFSIVCHTVAIWLTIALAIFRYIFICKPTRGSFYCSQQRACFVVVIVIILTMILCIPNYAVNTFNYHPGTDTIHTLHNNSLVEHINTNFDSFYFPDIKKDSNINKVTHLVNSWVQAILIKLVPCFMLVTLTLLLLHAMHKAYRKRLKLKSQGRRAESDKHGEHNRTTGMLLAIVVLFTVTELPQGILTLMNIFVPCFTDAVYYKLGDLLDIMALINNSVNFVLYCTMSKQFRTTFAAIFCPSQPSSRPGWLKMKLTPSQYKSKSSIETRDTATNLRNVSVTSRQPDKMAPESIGNSVQCNTTEVAVSHMNNERRPLPLTSSNGISTHTHGYSPDHSYV
ncbi:unnamed protein product [Candidula unifasciata]|uniref:G-protein coupled receptors family 1 profile domain-containing protein n=1 Tax=Candidula unifasciata TaxID=100452 RepID=A0A8S3Z8I6_9EUPU|nr:unnamed protein product [Candidula unifasciata]